jgi:hypothetical protein
MEDILKAIPEKSKAVFNRLKEDWEVMNIPEKAGVVALAIITSPAIAVIAADFLGRRHVRKLEKMV